VVVLISFIGDIALAHQNSNDSLVLRILSSTVCLLVADSGLSAVKKSHPAGWLC